MGAIKRIFRYLRGIPDLHITYRHNSNLEPIGFCDASYGTGNPENVRSTSERMYFLSERGHSLQHKYPNDSGAINNRGRAQRARSKRSTCCAESFESLDGGPSVAPTSFATTRELCS